MTECPESTTMRRLSAAAVPSCWNIGSWAVAGGRIASYLPFTINTGVLTRGRKLGAFTSGSLPKNGVRPPESSAAAANRLSRASRIGATSEPML